MNEIELIRRATVHDDRVAIRTVDGQRTYREILDASHRVAGALLDGESDLQEARVAYLIPAGFEYVATQWGIWQAGGIAVPLSLSATEPELEYTLTDSEVSCVITTKEQTSNVENLCDCLKIRHLLIDEAHGTSKAGLPNVDSSRRAMILYTSGTTSRPKGVVTTHDNIRAQIETLVEAWDWQTDDRIPLFLPLHHIHGIINVMSCALWSGATLEPFPRFELSSILQRVTAGAYSVFMAVPTIYVKLIQHLQSLSAGDRQPIIDGFAEMRLMVSGSAALPASVHETWTELTSQKLLERYGMTEIGMGLSNPYSRERRPGAVGQPLPGVELQLKSEKGHVVDVENEPGEIQIKGPSVFKEYWNRSEGTAEAFEEGWFRTGDIAVLEDGYYRIMGRQSVDIIKSGGYKLSALEIEASLLDHEAIAECAVVGLSDETWGEAVAVACVLADRTELSLSNLKTWCEGRLSKYKIPKHLLVVESLPRNAMGKITKPAVAKLFE